MSKRYRPGLDFSTYIIQAASKLLAAILLPYSYKLFGYGRCMATPWLELGNVLGEAAKWICQSITQQDFSKFLVRKKDFSSWKLEIKTKTKLFCFYVIMTIKRKFLLHFVTFLAFRFLMSHKFCNFVTFFSKESTMAFIASLLCLYAER